jgi:DNA-binding NarL/FixJ family response regulator
MSAVLATLAVDAGQIEELVEMVAVAHGRNFDHVAVAARLRLLAAWLIEQARLLDAERGLGAQRVPSVRVAGHGHLPRLTRRELEIVSRITRGMSNRQIAEELVIATSTTERHVANIFSKLNMRSRARVAAWAIENGLSA